MLLADEPTGNLDSRTGEDILDLIRDLSLSLGMSVVMVTHERALAERFAQRLIFLGDGKLISCSEPGPPANTGSGFAGQGGAGMKGYDLLELAVRNLRQSKLRNGLTTVGISVGVASLVAMLSLGVGLQQLATRRLAGSGMFDTVFVTSKQDFRGFDREEDQKDQHPEKAPVLDEAAREQMAHLRYVTEVEPEIRVMGEIIYSGQTHFGFVTGLPMSARENEAFENLQGKFFSRSDADEVILLNDFAKELDPNDPKALDRSRSHAALRRAPAACLRTRQTPGRPQLSGDQHGNSTAATITDFPSCARRSS